MSIYFEKARELGKLILESEQAINLSEAMQKFNKDKEAKEKFNEYKAYQKDIKNSMQAKKMTQEEFKTASKRLAEMAIELKQNPTIAILTFAENEFNRFVNQVMNILKLTITGEDIENVNLCSSSKDCGCCSNKCY